MKQYWSIPGPSKAPKQPCLAFYKYDGSNIRAEWSRKQGWYKFGSRNVLLDESHDFLGEAPQVFLDTYGDALPEVFKKEKAFRGVDSFVVFCEFFGPNSFAGIHDTSDKKEIVLIDVNANRKGIVLPRDFVNIFGHLKIPPVVYEGNFNSSFIEAVKRGEYGLAQSEGVVVKGVLASTKNPQHGLWMSKVKTQWWMNELRRRAETNAEMKRVLTDNEREQA